MRARPHECEGGCADIASGLLGMDKACSEQEHQIYCRNHVVIGSKSSFCTILREMSHISGFHKQSSRPFGRACLYTGVPLGGCEIPVNSGVLYAYRCYLKLLLR